MPTDHGPSWRSRPRRAAAASGCDAREPLEVERRRDAHERRRSPRREPAGRDLRRREPREVGPGRREHESRMRLSRATDDRRARCAGPPRQVTSCPAKRAHERVQARAGARGAQTASARHRPGQQLVALGHGEERRDVVVECEQEAQAIERRGSSSGASSAICSSPSERWPTRAWAGPAAVAKTSSAPSALRAQRAVAHARERHAQVVGPARPELDQHRHGTSARGRRRAPPRSRAQPRRASRCARGARAAAPPGRAAGRGPPRRRGAAPRRRPPACSSAAPPRRRWARPTSLRPSPRVTSSYVPVPAKHARRAAARSAVGSAATSRGGTARSSAPSGASAASSARPASRTSGRRRRSRADARAAGRRRA